jgi:hypothetical protein
MMKNLIINLLLITLFLFGFSQKSQAVVLNDSLPTGKNFDKAIFRLWYPENAKTLSGIIVLTPGSNGDGRVDINDLFWQQLAQKNNFALVGCYFTDIQHEEMNIEKYANAKEGSGQALLDGISLFAKKSGHTELANAPLLLWGHSAGGQFNYEFACWKPERVIAFVVNKGGFYYTALASMQTRKVPGLFFIGAKDMDARKDIVKGLFSMNRRIGALWAFAEEPEAAHEIGQTKKLAGIYFNEIIPLRIQSSSEANSSNSLLAIPDNSGFIGDINAARYQSFYKVQESDTPTAWLPSSVFAEAWQSFIKKNSF